jgi:predicted ribosomally synthesized peptide with SipW-like signal peptide
VHTTRKVLLSLLVVAALGSVVALGAFSAFSSSTSNSGNTFTAGTVEIEDNDSDTALYTLSNQKPGVTTSRCIRVTYTGSLASAVRLYSSSVTPGAQYVNLTITPGTQGPATFPSCTDFTADAGGPIYTGTLAAFAAAHTGYANGLAAPGPNTAAWATNEDVVYRFSVGVQDTNAAQGATTGTHAFTWEAQNT